MRPILVLLMMSAAASAFASVGPAAAEPLTGRIAVDGNRACGSFSADPRRWSEADGSPVRFVAAAIDDGADWIGLGYDARGFWSVEAMEGACSTCLRVD